MEKGGNYERTIGDFKMISGNQELFFGEKNKETDKIIFNQFGIISWYLWSDPLGFWIKQNLTSLEEELPARFDNLERELKQKAMAQ